VGLHSKSNINCSFLPANALLIQKLSHEYTKPWLTQSELRNGPTTPDLISKTCDHLPQLSQKNAGDIAKTLSI
jgi:hypothetical protein